MSRSVAVLMGGWTAEREVSLVSGRECAKALAALGYDVREIDVTRDLGALVDGADARARRGVQRAARPRRRGRHGPGRARIPARALYPFGRAGLGRGHGQADGAQRVRRRRAAAGRGQGGVGKRTRIRRRDGAALCGEAGQRRLERRRAHRAAPSDNSWANEAKSWSFGERALVEAYVPGREITVAVMGERALGALEIRPANGLLRLRRQIRAGRLRSPDAGADPRQGLRAGAGDRAGRTPGAGLPRREPLRSALRRHQGRARDGSCCWK